MEKYRAPLLILLLAFALRVTALNIRPVWYDEAFAYFLAAQDLPRIASGTAADTMPPLYYALLHFWYPLAGATPFALRMLSVALSLLIVGVVYAVGKRAFDARVGTWAMFFTALAPFEIYHAQEMRMYTLLALGGMLYLFGVLGISRHKAKINWVLIVVGSVIALYSHNLAFLSLGAADVYFLLRREWQSLAKLVVAQFVSVLLFLPWLFSVPTQLTKIERAFWTQPPGIVDTIQMLVVFTSYLPLPEIPFDLAVFTTLMIFALAVIKLVRMRKAGRTPALYLLITFAVIPPAAMFILSYIISPVFVPRGVIVSSLAYYLLLAFLVARARLEFQVGVGLFALAMAVMALPFFYTSYGEWRRAPFDASDAFLRGQFHPGDLVLHDNKLSFFPMHFYDSPLPQEFLADPPGSANDTLARGSMEAFDLYPFNRDAVLRQRGRVWFVIFQTAIDQAPPEGHPNLVMLDREMKRVSMTPFGDLRVYLYENR